MTSSYFLSASVEAKNSTTVNETPSATTLSIFSRSSSSAMRSSSGLVTRRSRSFGSAPGMTAEMSKPEISNEGSSSRGIDVKLKSPIATRQRNATSVNW